MGRYNQLVKLRVVSKYHDVLLKKHMMVGDTLEVDRERAELLLSLKTSKNNAIVEILEIHNLSKSKK